MATASDAFVAVNRFGLGARPNELAAASSDPRGWLKAQLGRRDLPAELRGLDTATRQTRRYLDALGPKNDNVVALDKLYRGEFRTVYGDEVARRTTAMARSPAPFHERLVAFWSNHFTVSVKRPPVAGLCGAFEREAIRPHVGGRFADMLLAVTHHQAMLIYLDNAFSLGPNSPAGRYLNRGLNENLAREIVELHTLGVRGGYTQDDVIALAKLITGWSLTRQPRDGDVGAFRFHQAAHEPGAKLLLGIRYEQGGEAEGEAALRALARHPATAEHIATKLVRHFIADEPPAAEVERLTRVFRDSDGDLAAVSAALVDSPAAWSAPLGKYKTPQDFVLSVFRAADLVPDEPRSILAAFDELGQLPFFAVSPAGWPDTAAAWAGPEAVVKRAEWSLAFARRVAAYRKPLAMFGETIAPVASTRTRDAVARAPSVEQGLALLLASPEFQRR